MDLNTLPSLAAEYAAYYGAKIILAIVIFVVGKWLASKVASLVATGLDKNGVDHTLSRFVKNILYYETFARDLIYPSTFEIIEIQ